MARDCCSNVCVFVVLCSALEDAKAALRLDASWPKGYYRQGRAYAGLKVSFRCVLKEKGGHRL